MFGLARPRLDLALSFALLAAVGLSRVAAFPASIWEQDEAYFTAAVVQLDVAERHPHPPWFPLWIGLAALLHGCGLAPATALQAISFGFAVWLPLPLVALWRRLLPGSGAAAAAAVLFLVTPVAWLLAARAFTGTAATALMVAALACWLPTGTGSWRPATGSAAAALAVLVRPHFAAPLVVAAVIVLSCRRGASWRSVVLPGVGIVLAGGIVFAAAAGGLEGLRQSLIAHAHYHFAHLGEADLGLAGSGLARGLGHPALALGWLGAALVGAVRLLRRRSSREAAIVVVGALLALLAVVLGLSNPAHARYWVPVLALSAGLVVAAIEPLHATLCWFVVGVAVVASAAWVVPALPAYRSELSPPLAALRYAAGLAADRHALLVVDRTLVAFVDAERALGRLEGPLMFDHVLVSGLVPPRAAERVVAVFDRGHNQLLDGGERIRVFRCPSPVLRRLGQDRFLDVTVVDQARLVTGGSGAPARR